MAVSTSSVYLSTLLLEKNRWNGKGPSLLVSDWIEATGEAGFAGLDLWMSHLRFTSRSEWELLKEKATDADLDLAFISSIIPTDDSEKSQKARDSILEACDYFHPNQLKFTLAEGTLASEEKMRVALDSIQIWSQDLNRDVGILFDPGPENKSTSRLRIARSGLTGPRFKSVLHPFLMSLTEFSTALADNGDYLCCLGAQAMHGKDWILLEENRKDHQQVIRTAMDQGFSGAWIVEFTQGIGRPGEDIYDLFDNAEKDLNFLNESFARSSKAKKI